MKVGDSGFLLLATMEKLALDLPSQDRQLQGG